MRGVRRSGARIAPTVAVLLVVAAAAGAIGTSRAGLVATPGSVTFIDGRTGKVTAAVALPGRPLGCVVSTGAAWVTDYQRHVLYRIDIRRHRLAGTVSLRFAPSGVAAGPDGIWVRGADALVLVDPSSARVTGTVSVPAGKSFGTFYSPVAEAGGSLWVGNPLEILRIDLATRKVVATNQAIAANPVAFADGLGAMWATDMGGVLYRLDPSSAVVLGQTTIDTANADRPMALVVYGDAVWVTDASGNKAWKVDASGKPSATVRVGRAPFSIAPAGGSIWVGAQNDDTLAQIDPSSAKRVRTVKLSHSPVALCGNGDQLVVAGQ